MHKGGLKPHSFHFQRPGVYSAAYGHDGTVHYKEALKSFEIRMGPWRYCNDYAESDVKQHSRFIFCF